MTKVFKYYTPYTSRYAYFINEFRDGFKRVLFQIVVIFLGRNSGRDFFGRKRHKFSNTQSNSLD